MIKKFFNFIFILIVLFAFNELLFAEPILTFDEIKSYALNNIRISNLDYQKIADFKIVGITFEGKNVLLFKGKVTKYVKNFVTYFYADPNFEKVILYINLDNEKLFEYDFKVNPNKDAEKDFENFSFTEKYHYEIINPYSNNPVIKISSNYNQDFYKLAINSFLYYYDKKQIDNNSIILFIFTIILITFILIIFQDKKVSILFLSILVICSTFYIVNYNNQNFILKGYIENPIVQNGPIINESNKSTEVEALSLNMNIDSNINTLNSKFLLFYFTKEKTKVVKIWLKNYSFLFEKLYFQNSKILLKENFDNIKYFIAEPSIFSVVFENNQYYINLNSLMIFGKINNEEN